MRNLRPAAQIEPAAPISSPARIRLAWRCVAGLCLAAWMGGCGGASYDGTLFVDGNVRFAIEAPPAPWTRISVAEETDLAWSHHESAAVIHVSGSCDPRLDIPLPALTNHLLIGFTARETVTQEVEGLSGREALVTHVRARLDGVPRELKLVVLKKDECVYDFALVSPPGDRFEHALATFDAMVASFGDR